MSTKMKTKNIVLGANGYLGKHLTNHLITNNQNVVCYDYLSDNSKSSNIVHFDITNIKDLEKIDWSADYLYLFSGLTGTKIGFEKYNQFIQINELGLLNVLNIIKDLKQKPKIIFPSTRLVYKGSDIPLNENAEKETNTIYALNKLSCEKVLEMYQKIFGINYTIFRICIPYGTHFNEYSFGTISFMLHQAQKNGEITLFGDGALKRTFTHIDDICEQIFRTSINNSSNNEIFNVGGETYSLKEVAEYICKANKAKINYALWPEIDRKIESGSTIFNDEKITKYFTKKYINLKDWINNFPS
jgi:UDP-glucose 4-epimerase